MGARSYVPVLGRFLQPDPVPGGSANAYAYTDGNPINEADPTGDFAFANDSGGRSAIGEASGTDFATGMAEGAVTPAPVNTQIEEEAHADPPWAQNVADAGELELTFRVRIRSGNGMAAHAAMFSLLEAKEWVENKNNQACNQVC